ncbi:MAG: arginine--tRNA ligase [Thaumarchaeota archaeon]|nr:arginine--tRNA ligase [Nitrososphaerota archaeon]
MVTNILINEISLNIKKIIMELNLPSIKFTVEPTRSNFGYIMCNVSFLLVKYLHKKPFEIAQLIAKKYQKFLNDLIIKIEPHPTGYLNFFINYSKLNELILKKSCSINYGKTNIGNGANINIEHTSINPNKPIHIGHVRNIIIGDTIARLLKKINYNVNVLNYVDDSGLQVADLIVGFKCLGFNKNPKNSRFDVYCGNVVYVKTTEKYKNDPNLLKIRQNILQELERKQSSTTKFANEITKKILNKQLETCWRLNSSYDCLNFESQIIHSGLWKSVFNKLQEMKLIYYEQKGKNAGCWIVKTRIGNHKNDKIIIRSDGTATYIAKDITYALWKLGIIKDPFNYKKYIIQHDGKILLETTLDDKYSNNVKFSTRKTITVIDSRQSYLQNIISELVKKFDQQIIYTHLKYEAIKLSQDTAKELGLVYENKPIQMSGRKGTYIIADYFLDMLKYNILQKAKKRYNNLDMDTLSKLAENLAVSTLRYEMIKIDLSKMIVFDFKESLDVDGNTALYIQYAYARASRILEKAKIKPSFDVEYELLDNQYEHELIKIIGEYEICICDAAINLAPKIIATYCYKLATLFNSFYEHNTVLNLKNTQLTNARLCLVNSFIFTLQSALSLLGMKATTLL